MKNYGKVLSVVVVAALASCKSEETMVNARSMTDALYLVLSTDRTVYTQTVVNRLVGEEKVITASEQWREEKALPLPAQMFRLGAEMARTKSTDFTYKLLSEWPINKANAPRTKIEKEGMTFIRENPGKAFYSEENRGGTRYFTAVYADVASAQACVGCHNNHRESPKRDFKLNDLMGGTVITIALKSK